ncbi:cell division ATP-binding protein FtsE [Eudoraea sp.]|jgi:cell division transport system ATP-binding protein|uniref:cell division ATP-binding protein FtsE n=1 Tax=Eudoraea sp. TaxID=1979955 RepID=UPI003C740745
MGEQILHLKDVTIFQKENMVLQNISLEVKKGEFVYLIGKTGSGKSSFMKTLYADLPLTKGIGEIVGFNLKTLKEKDIPFLRRKLGIVFQDFKLLPDRNINKNLEFILKATGWKDPEKMKIQIEKVLHKVGMKTKGFKFPHELSGGEQQRVAIARALLNDPEIILADEPTGNLDPQTSVEIMKVLQEINKAGRTILMATHDYALLLKYPSKTLKCDDAKVFEVIQKAI